MKIDAKGHRFAAASTGLQDNTMLRGVAFGAAFVAGLTFFAGYGLAQTADAQSTDVQPTDVQTTQASPESVTTDTATTQQNKADQPEKAVTQPVDDATANKPMADIPTGDAKSAVVFMYHRFGEDEYPSTNITAEQFNAHIKELTNGSYTVMGVSDIVSALQDDGGLPDRAVGITIDDAYRSVYELAWPVFKKNNIPFTVFVSTEQIDAGYSNYMTWDMVRELVRGGATIGGHSANHAHLPDLGIAGVKKELSHSAERFKQEIGFVPDIFAYPYGEADADVIKAVKDAGYKAAFGQQSGAMSDESDFMYLPRFALNEHYGAMDRFSLAANSLPLRVSDVTPSDYTLKRNPPAFGFTLKKPQRNVSCYPSDGEATMNRLGDERVEIRMDGPVSSGRWRINCTALGPKGRWQWFGMLYTVP